MNGKWVEKEEAKLKNGLDVIQCRNATRITTKKMSDNDFVYFENSHISNNN